jgi:hypothetical protein
MPRRAVTSPDSIDQRLPTRRAGQLTVEAPAESCSGFDVETEDECFELDAGGKCGKRKWRSDWFPLREFRADLGFLTSGGKEGNFPIGRGKGRISQLT